MIFLWQGTKNRAYLSIFTVFCDAVQRKIRPLAALNEFLEVPLTQQYLGDDYATEI